VIPDFYWTFAKVEDDEGGGVGFKNTTRSIDQRDKSLAKPLREERGPLALGKDDERAQSRKENKVTKKYSILPREGR